MSTVLAAVAIYMAISFTVCTVWGRVCAAKDRHLSD